MIQKRIFELFGVIRSACPAPVWSQGTKIARNGWVQGVSEDEDEIVLRVHTPGAVVDPTVVLYPEDEDWECDCRNRSDNCSHVAAAAIAIRQAREQGQRMPTAKVERPELEYHFSKKGDSLVLSRRIVTPEGRSEILTTPLMAGVTNRQFPLGFRPAQHDLAVDRIIGRALRAELPLPREKIEKTFAELTSESKVRWEGRRVSLGDDPLEIAVSVEDHEEKDIAVKVRPGIEVDEVVADGVVRCGNTLYVVSDVELCGPKLEKLPATMIYERSQFARLVTEVLPELRSRARVVIASKRLPQISDVLRPRLVFEMSHRENTVVALPQLAYGRPPCVRIDGGEMVYLGGDIPVRNKAAERRLIDELRDELNLVPGRRAVFSGRDATLFMEKVHRWGKDALDSTQQPMRDAPPLVPQIDVSDDRFDVSFVFEGQNRDDTGGPRFADPQSVLDAWRQGLSLAPLRGGGYAPLPAAWLDSHGHLLADILAARQTDKTVPTAAIPSLAKLCDDLDVPHQPCFDRLKPLLGDFEVIPEATLPKDLEATLRGYQRQGVNWLAFLRDAGLGAVLADDMGLGKTLQVLCVLEGRSLVVCPTSVLHNWAQEIERFRPGLKVCVFHGPKRKLEEDAEITLTTYALLRGESELLQAQKWDAVVLDEAQNIKNPDSQAARAAFGLSADFRAALSGTPVENRLDELWSLFQFCNKGVLGTRSGFERRFSEPIALGDEKAAAHLRAKIRPFVLRRLKQEVALELPPRSDQVLYCELDDRERAVYDALRASTSKELVDKLQKGAGVMAALEALLRLRQSACHTGLVPGRDARTSSKVELLMDRLETTVANGHKALVFSQWTSLLDKIEPRLESSGISYLRLDGTTRDRGAVVGGFQSDDGPPVMLVSLKAGGTGLNLTAADHVFIVDPWWNPAVEDQAADRTHRIGQDKPVMVYRLVAENTVEQRIVELQKRKRAIAHAALSSAEQAAALTREDLMSLLDL